MNHLRAIRNVTPIPGYRLEISWSDDTCSVVDLSSDLRSDGILSSLLDPALFRTVRVGERARTVEWTVPLDDASKTLVDIDADALFKMAEPAVQGAERRPRAFEHARH